MIDARTISSFVRALSEDADGGGHAADAIEILRLILLARNLIEHHTVAAVMSLSLAHTAADQGRTMRELLIELGCAPAVAQRLVRLADRCVRDPWFATELTDGRMPAEHADAIARGMAQIEDRTTEPLADSERHNAMSSLLAQLHSGATPAQITAHARQIGNELSAMQAEVLPTPSEDRSLNELGIVQTPDGRLRLQADLDIVVGEKMVAALDRLSTPRPEPDGSRYRRPFARRRADALDTLLDLAADHDGSTSMTPRVSVALTIPSDTPERSALAFLGPVSIESVTQLTCDAEWTPMILDSEKVPLDVGRRRRLFTAAQRKALLRRDECCVKCGAPASWTQAHHIVHWADGGATDLDNGCLLCTSCHDAVHNAGWEVVLGADRHPWLVPPVTVDARRRPRPAYNRRTMTYDDAPADNLAPAA
ncbi:HNH endonuclease [Gordonia soli]|uniref:HNH nuclease domain-containing protein n=1 Tax=Gordonia soli NBRC 108243 TaxID=1223545 RepID=M0QJR2_9ACTN|nr:HNH endonuclease signature motif containing protein [Gordonia soli]GAC67677.1 hypothetical protein GS4_08_02620 [Gordonia soli NBRC 108243]